MSVDTFCKRHSSRMSNNLLDGSFINAVFFHHGNCSVARTVWRPLNVNYNPEAPKPEMWLKYLKDLVEEEDIPTIQEYLGYLLICRATFYK